MSQFAERGWYQRAWYWYPLLPLLLPLSGLLWLLASLRRRRLQAAAMPLPVPVLVVGNISLGGTGKTPLMASLASALRAEGWRPGIISRGYGGRAQYPLLVTDQTQVSECGDEPRLLASRTGLPLVVDPDRLRAAHTLLAQCQCNLILSDDGLQHYRLARQLELCVIDGQRGLGNGLLFPAGPLREAPARLDQVDAIVVNGGDPAPLQRASVPAFAMTLAPRALVNLVSGERRPLQALGDLGPWQVICGIGNPQRFFDTLAALGAAFDARVFPDHHDFRPQDLQALQGRPLLMTEKDAVKCRSFARPDWWYLSVDAQLPEAFFATLRQLLGPPPA